MGKRVQITEYLDVDLINEMWVCNVCGNELISATKNYKKGCLAYARDPRDIWDPVVDEPHNFAPDPNWVNVVEFYCPSCGTMIENEVLPIGHPITYDIELDIKKLKEKHLGGAK